VRRFPTTFWHAFATDFLVRSAYQMGKTPVLPLLAATIGAGEIMTGLIVAVSVTTGMVCKPFFGALSDDFGRRAWWLAALCLSAVIPFFYQFISTPDQLMAMRIVHGLTTAILGPVTLAYIVELGPVGSAARLGWFGLARQGGYLVAPAVAGWMLTFMTPADVFTIVGLVSCVAFVPFLFMRFDGDTDRRFVRPGGLGLGNPLVVARSVVQGLRHASTRGATWLAGGLETVVYFVTYGLKAFLPFFAIHEGGFDALAVGLFFTVQEFAHLATRPVGGWIGDRAGYRKAMAGGMMVIAVSLWVLPQAETVATLLVVAVIGGIGQGLISPSTVALVGEAAGERHLGAGLGVYGTLRNLGKVAGPVVTGATLSLTDFESAFFALAVGLAVAALLLLVSAGRRRSSQEVA
jgi:MFS family permease